MSTFKYKPGDRVIALQWPRGSAGTMVKLAKVNAWVRWDGFAVDTRVRVEDLRLESKTDITKRERGAAMRVWQDRRPETKSACVQMTWGDISATGVTANAKTAPEMRQAAAEMLLFAELVRPTTGRLARTWSTRFGASLRSRPFVGESSFLDSDWRPLLPRGDRVDLRAHLTDNGSKTIERGDVAYRVIIDALGEMPDRSAMLVGDPHLVGPIQRGILAICGDTLAADRQPEVAEPVHALHQRAGYKRGEWSQNDGIYFAHLSRLSGRVTI